MTERQIAYLYAGLLTLVAMAAWSCVFAYLGFIAGFIAIAMTLLAQHYAGEALARGTYAAAESTLAGIKSLRARFNI